MHYNGIFKTMYTFYQAFVTTKCSLVCSSKYYSLHLERWCAKVKKLYRNTVWLRTGWKKDTTGICCLIQPCTPDHQPRTHTPFQACFLLSLNRCLVWIPAVSWAWPGCFASTSLTVLICKMGMLLSILGDSKDVIKSCKYTGTISSVTFAVKPSLTTPPFSNLFNCHHSPC